MWVNPSIHGLESKWTYVSYSWCFCPWSSRSRSRSRSRSNSPPHNREKKYPRGYQNNREFRGYHRGFRRPYNFRGRGRGYFQRGRYQRGGGGGGSFNNYNNNNNNFRPNWKNHKQNLHKKQRQQQQNWPQARFNNPQKISGSPSNGPVHHFDKSPSTLSRLSHHSSASSHSSSPKSKPALPSVYHNAKDVKEERSASAQVQDGEVENGAAEELIGKPVGIIKEGGSSDGKTEGKWQSITACSSPKRKSPLSAEQSSNNANRPGPSAKNSNDGAPSWQTTCGLSSQEGLQAMLSSFDFFSNEEYSDGDKTAISIAFGK